MKKVVGYIVGAAVAAGVGFFVKDYITKRDQAATAVAPSMPPPGVIAIVMENQPIDVLKDRIAHVEPVQEVLVRSEVSGYIDEVHFVEGSNVKAGDLLFSIDQNKYDALYNVKLAELESAKAELVRADRFLKRLQEAGPRSISQTDLDTAESSQLKASAAVQQAEANLSLSKIDLNYSQVRANISGQIGKAEVTKGNYISSEDELAEIVQTDPIRVVFSIPDRDYLTFRRKELAGDSNGFSARIRLPNGEMLGVVGKKDFDDNIIDSQTGTMAVRYLFDNKDGMLVPGGYVNVLLGDIKIPTGLLIPQEAILTNSDGSYVLTVSSDNKAMATPIKLGGFIGTDRVVLSGLNVGDKVIIEGVQKARPGMEVKAVIEEKK